MPYKTRQEVLRAAADWMDVCAAAGVEARCKVYTATVKIKQIIFDGPWGDYEFPLALLEGKEVWVGSELYNIFGEAFTVEECHRNDNFDGCSWNPPKPKTVMVEMLVEDAEWIADSFNSQNPGHLTRAAQACKKALGIQKWLSSFYG